jgi:hypothetical protein
MRPYVVLKPQNYKWLPEYFKNNFGYTNKT